MGIASKKIKLTNDYWARDYMPIQLGENEFLKCRYYPDYLVKSKNKKDIETITDPTKVLREWELIVVPRNNHRWWKHGGMWSLYSYDR